jgi:hypothetical protein
MAKINNVLNVSQSSLNQDNTELFKLVSIVGNIGNVSKNAVLNTINNVSGYTITEIQSLWFRVQYVSIVGGVKILSSTELYKIANKGKGVYGLGGIQFESTDIEIVSSNEVSVTDYLINPLVQQIEISDLEGLTISEYVNAFVPTYIIQSQEIAPILFITPEGSYLFLNIGGIYGLTASQTTESDFQLIPNFSNPNQNNINRYIEVTLSEIGIEDFDDELITQQALYDYILENPINIQDIELYKWKITENPAPDLLGFGIYLTPLNDVCDYASPITVIITTLYHNGVELYPVVGDSIFEDPAGTILANLNAPYRLQSGTNKQISAGKIVPGFCL